MGLNQSDQLNNHYKRPNKGTRHHQHHSQGITVFLRRFHGRRRRRRRKDCGTVGVF